MNANQSKVFSATFQLEVSKKDVGNGFSFNQLSRRVATITNKKNKNFRVAYFGFDTHKDAVAFTKWLRKEGYDFELRVSKRMSTRLEVKVRGMKVDLIASLAKKDLSQSNVNVIQFPNRKIA